MMATNNNNMNSVKRIQLMDSAAQAVVDIFWQALEQSANEKATVEEISNGIAQITLQKKCSDRPNKEQLKQRRATKSVKHLLNDNMSDNQPDDKLSLDASVTSSSSHSVFSPYSLTHKFINHSVNPSDSATSTTASSGNSIDKKNRRDIAEHYAHRRAQALIRQVRPCSSPNMSNIAWPSAAEFTAELGRAKIIEFIDKTWAIPSANFSYTVEHLYTAALRLIRRYKFRVVWKYYNARRPLSTGMACVYFNVDVPYGEDNDLHNDAPVDVTYTFHRDRSLHRPGRSRYHTKFFEQLEQEGRESEMTQKTSVDTTFS